MRSIVESKHEWVFSSVEACDLDRMLGCWNSGDS